MIQLLIWVNSCLFCVGVNFFMHKETCFERQISLAASALKCKCLPRPNLLMITNLFPPYVTCVWFQKPAAAPVQFYLTSQGPWAAVSNYACLVHVNASSHTILPPSQNDIVSPCIALVHWLLFWITIVLISLQKH